MSPARAATGGVLACARPEEDLRNVVGCKAGGLSSNRGSNSGSSPRSPCVSATTSVRPARLRQSSFGDDDELVHELPSTWSLQQFQAAATSLLKEYFVARALGDAASGAQDLLKECPGEADEFGVVAIRTAIDRDDSAQEAVVELLCELHRLSTLEPTALVRTFEKLFCAWEDLALDAPKTPEMLLRILCGCMAGKAVPKSLLTKIPENLMNVGLSQVGPALGEGYEVLKGVAADLKNFKRLIAPIIDEYFSLYDERRTSERLAEISMGPYQHEFVKKVIVASFSKPDPAASREAVLVLLQGLTADGMLTKDDLQWGLSRLIVQLEDLELDIPKASDMAIEHIACMIGDELVSVPFLRKCRMLRIGGAMGLRVIDSAQRRTPEYTKKYLGTSQFKREIHTMILEYFNSGDAAEFGRCVRDLAPISEDRSAELVCKIMLFAMERTGTECEEALILLVSLSRNEEISDASFEFGFDDLYKRMPDLLLDVPDAREMARSFVVEMKKAKILRQDWLEPQK